MNIGLIGYGKMGKMIEKMAVSEMQVKAVFDQQPSFSASAQVRQEVEGIDVLIDFSVPEVAVDHIFSACELGVNLVVGTTGWQHRLSEVEQRVEKSGIGLVYASNFSLGVNLFYRVLSKAAALFSHFEDYDVFLHEAHHKFKLDAPSGTALKMKSLLQEAYGSGDIDTACTRSGHIPGTHRIGFDSFADTVELVHTARNREGFARGALLAADWIAGKRGCFAFDTVLDELLHSK